jgi:hypothetical protein
MSNDDAYDRIDKMWADKQDEENIKQLQQLADEYIKQYRHEIVRDGDWWHGTPEYSFNIHSPDDDGWFHINVYKHDADKGMDDYTDWIDLPKVFLEETIR